MLHLQCVCACLQYVLEKFYFPLKIKYIVQIFLKQNSYNKKVKVIKTFEIKY